MAKKLFAVVLAAAMVLGLVSTAFAASPFPDTAGIPEESTIALLKTLGLVKGDDKGLYRPNDTITRAEFCALVVRALGLETAAQYLQTPTIFVDVTPAHAWAYGYINVAVTKGIIKGYGDGKFGPQDPITEAQALTMVMRALGYKDSLPGQWPLNYIIEGAKDSVGLVKSGFVPELPANRAWIATLFGSMLDAKPVTEDKDNPGTFNAGSAPFKATLNVVKVVEGEVTAVDTTNKKLTIGTEAIAYDDSLFIYGDVASVSALKGYTVSATTKTISGTEKIVFVKITNKAYVSGKVTAVDVINNTVTVGGLVYPVVAGFAAEKNGTTLTGTDAAKLIALLDTTANVWVNADGEVYKVVARYLDQTGKTLDGKNTIITSDGVQYKLNFVGTFYELASGAVINRNGQAASFADLQIGDSCDFALESGKIVWIDAWNQKVENVQLTAKTQVGTTYTITVKSGTSTLSFACSDATVYNPLVVGEYYTLSIGRDGKVYAASQVTSTTTTTTGVIAGTTVETKLVDGTPTVTYKVSFTDGTSFDVPFSTAGLVLTKDNGDIAIAGPDYTDEFSYFEVGDALKIVKELSGKVTEIKLYSQPLTGTAAVVDGKLTVGGNEIELASTCSLTLNGTSASLAALDGATVSVTWDVANDNAISVVGKKFDEKSGSSVKQITSDQSGNYVFTLVNGTTVTATSSTKVVRGGSASTLSAVQLADKLSFDAETATYIEATPDNTAPDVDSYSATYDDPNDKLTVTVAFDDEIYELKAYVDGVERTMTSTDRKTFTVEISDVTEKPATITLSVSAKDYAGNAVYKVYTNVPVN